MPPPHTSVHPSIVGTAIVAPTMPPVIGVWSQPIRLHAPWKARGINTLVRYEADGGAATLDQFLASAKANGLNVWLQWGACRPQDLLNPIVTAICNDPDEPDGVGATAPATMVSNYAAIRAALAAAGRNLPVWCDFDGNKIPYNQPAVYTAYAAACDVMGEDVYPFNMAVVGGVSSIADRVGSLKKASGGKPIIAVIECSNQDLNKQGWTKGNDASGTPLGPKMRGPTSDEFAAEVQSAIAAGVCGIVYFPDQIGQGWEGFDGTPPDVEARMKTVNATLAATKVPVIPLPPLPSPAPAPPPASGVGAVVGSSAPLHGKGPIVIDGTDYWLSGTKPA